MLRNVGFWRPWSRCLGVGVLVVLLGLGGCGGRSPNAAVPPPQIAEVAPPPVVQGLSTMLAATTPRVEISTPVSDIVLDRNEVSVQFQVEGMPVFKDETLGLGPHLNILLDNQFYQSVYDLTKPLVFKDIAPGTHTIRAIAAFPWEESFKQPSAQAQTTFHVFAKTPATVPSPTLPLLTYNQPTGRYGAEPILLDYVLQPGMVNRAGKNTVAIAPETATWQIRATVNGESFNVDLLEPIYLTGFKKGQNWVHLELLDSTGEPVDSVFNNTVRLIEYQPGGQDMLSQLMRNEVTLAEVAQIIDPNYSPSIPETVEAASTEHQEAQEGSTTDVLDRADPIVVEDPAPENTAVEIKPLGKAKTPERLGADRAVPEISAIGDEAPPEDSSANNQDTVDNN